MAFKERIVKQVTWDVPGETITGRLTSAQVVTYEDNIGINYLVRSEDGTIYAFRGATRLNQLMSPDDVGKLVEITFVGLDGTKEARPGRSQAKIFRVYVDDESVSKPHTPASPRPNGRSDDPFITDADIPF